MSFTFTKFDGIELPPGRVNVAATGNQSCSASWYAEPFDGNRGVVEISGLGGPEDWWVNRALVQGPNLEAIRGKGVGSALLQLALRQAVEMGATRVMVQPGGYDSKPRDQQRFYEKNGFKKTKMQGDWVWVWRKS